MSAHAALQEPSFTQPGLNVWVLVSFELGVGDGVHAFAKHVVNRFTELLGNT